MCVMRRHVPCRMCNGTGVRPCQDGSVSRLQATALSALRLFDDIRHVTFWIPITCIYMSSPLLSSSKPKTISQRITSFNKTSPEKSKPFIE